MGQNKSFQSLGTRQGRRVIKAHFLAIRLELVLSKRCIIAFVMNAMVVVNPGK